MKKLEQYLKNIEVFVRGFTCILILFSCIFSSIRTAYDSHISFYKKKPNQAFISILDGIGSISMYNLFLNYSGLNTGYGFFSPNVSSDFVIIQRLYQKGKEKMIFSNSRFKTKEGTHRFANLNSLFMDKVEIMEQPKISSNDSLRMKYLEVILKRLNTYTLNNDKLIDSVNTTVLLYHFPFLDQYPNIKPEFIKIESLTKTRKKDL